VQILRTLYLYKILSPQVLFYGRKKYIEESFMIVIEVNDYVKQFLRYQWCYESPKKEKVSHAFEHLIQNPKVYNGVRI